MGAQSRRADPWRHPKLHLGRS